jgi:hypothetical protein
MQRRSGGARVDRGAVYRAPLPPPDRLFERNLKINFCRTNMDLYGNSPLSAPGVAWRWAALILLLLCPRRTRRSRLKSPGVRDPVPIAIVPLHGAAELPVDVAEHPA